MALNEKVPSREIELPYQPSWYDRFTDWLEGLPGPLPGYYILGAFTSVGLYVAVQASQGVYAGRGFFGWHIFLALQPLIVLAWIHYLDNVAQTALERFVPAASADEATLAGVRYKMITLPARPALLATIMGIVLYFLIYGQSAADQLPVFQLATSTISIVTVRVYFLFMWGLLGLAVYHTVHQIAVIRELFANYTNADPYHPEPLYAFSGITGRTAAILMAVSYGWTLLLLQSGWMQTDPISGLSVNIFFAVFGLFIFTWPLWGAHQLLVEAKKDALAANTTLLQTVIKELHARVEQRNVAEMDDWHKALGALEIERTRIESLPTWPWRPEALRGLIAALIVPILVWFTQYLLERLLTN